MVDLTETLQVTGSAGPLALVLGGVTTTLDEVGIYALDMRNGRLVSGDRRIDLVETISANDPTLPHKRS